MLAGGERDPEVTPMNKDTFITCAVTADNSQSPHCPLTPSQIATSAIAAARAGASIVRVRVRDPDNGQYSNEVKLYREAIKQIRDSQVDVLINITCALGGYLCVTPD